VASGPAVGQVQYDPSQVGSSSTLNGFSIRLECDPLNESGSHPFPFTANALLSTNGMENGEAMINSTVYELDLPQVLEIEGEPYDGTYISVEYGSYFDLRAVPALAAAGISQCHFKIDGTDYITDSKCIYRHYGADEDRTFIVSAAAEDGVSNKGPYTEDTPIDVNVRPTVSSMTLSGFYFRTNGTMGIDINFTTALSGSFPSGSRVRLYDDSVSELASYSPSCQATGNALICSDELDMPSVPDGLYYLSAEATDEDGDLAMSRYKFLYVCDELESKGPLFDCAMADFDLDGLQDLCVLNGSVTTTTSTTSTTLFNMSTTTTLESLEHIDCSSVCNTYYLTNSFKCHDDSSCRMSGTDDLWVHDYRGDSKCFLGDSEMPVCCCRIEGVNVTSAKDPSISDLCVNGVLDNGEKGIDCGGICPPCASCYNGLMDSGEDGIDCGGDCPPCQEKSGVLTRPDEPKIFIVGTPNYVSFGDRVNFTVIDEGARGLQAYLEIKMPNGTIEKSMTDGFGKASVLSSMAGLWSVTASRKGFTPTFTVWATMPQMTPEVAVVTGTSIFIPLLALFLLRAYLRRRKGVVASMDAVLKLQKLGIIAEYAPIWVSEETLRELPQVEAFLEAVPLTDKEIMKADEISIKYEVNLELAKLMLIASKKKAEKIITVKYYPLETYNLTKIVPLWKEADDEQLT